MRWPVAAGFSQRAFLRPFARRLWGGLAARFAWLACLRHGGGSSFCRFFLSCAGVAGRCWRSCCSFVGMALLFFEPLLAF